MKESTFLHEVALESLVEDLPEYMALLIDNGLSLREFVTEERLETLYKKVGCTSRASQLYNCLSGYGFSSSS